MGLANYPACKLLILLGLGYNLKVRGSNPLPATKLFKINDLPIRFYKILFYGEELYFFTFWSQKSYRTSLLGETHFGTTLVF